MGPFYCLQDQRIYLDPSFFHDLQKLGCCSSSNACKFPEVLLIAHAVGQHVQNELGILPRVMQAQRASSSKAEVDQQQVRVELQADCFAGMWVSATSSIRGTSSRPCRPSQPLATTAPRRKGQGYSSTYSTSTQRKRWFMNGLKHGNVEACDTFSASTL
jgi:uncharacterized protein